MLQKIKKYACILGTNPMVAHGTNSKPIQKIENYKKSKHRNIEHNAAPPWNVETQKFNHWYHKGPTSTVDLGWSKKLSLNIGKN